MYEHFWGFLCSCYSELPNSTETGLDYITCKDFFLDGIHSVS